MQIEINYANVSFQISSFQRIKWERMFLFNGTSEIERLPHLYIECANARTNERTKRNHHTFTPILMSRFSRCFIYISTISITTQKLVLNVDGGFVNEG